MILVTGATGHVGAEVVGQLVALGRPVRAMTRRPEAASFPKGVEVVAGDCDDLAGDYGADISPVVEQVLGRRPITFREWAEKHFKEES